MEQQKFFVTTPLGMELLLAEELNSLHLDRVKAGRAGVEFYGDLESAYRTCLWSRLGNRVLLHVDRFESATPEALYAGIAATDWAAHLSPEGTLAVDFASSRSAITHTQFGAQKVKDAIVDQFRELHGTRPSVRLDRPDLRVNVYVDKDMASVGIDLSGDSLHKRGYRLEGGAAPLKENLAAAILMRADWPQLAREGRELIDPMCGSGTLLIEAALMAADIAPALLRDYFGFQAWKLHREDIWSRLLDEAKSRRQKGLSQLGPISGYDINHTAIHAALGNIDRAGLRGLIRVERRSAAQVRPGSEHGLVVVNPPYGERMGDPESLVALYTGLGELLQTHFQGWKASVFTGNPEMAFKLGIRAKKFYQLFNGALECKLFNLEVQPERFFTPHEDETGLSEEARLSRKLLRRAKALSQKLERSAGAEMVANRLDKNLKHLGRWAKREAIDCYRLYDADLPEYAVAVDIYRGEGQTWLHVQEYEAPSTIDPAKAEARLADALSVLPAVTGVPFEHIFLKIRRKQKGSAQYVKQGEVGDFHIVQEGGCRFRVNFADYLDTGLFLDHRPTRLMIQHWAKDKHFLNLFGYTGTASVHAAIGGASSTTTVDMSHTYLDWAQKNFELNGIKGYRHSLVQADCLAWLDAELTKAEGKFDLIFLDPPTFSNSKRMDESFDVQRDHVALLRKAAGLLSTDGMLIFSTNFRRFKLDREALEGLSFDDISLKTIPKDFERNPKIHYCWIVRRVGCGHPGPKIRHDVR